jgi:hypothetical protein
MQDHESFKDSTCQVDAATVDLRSADGTNTRKVIQRADITSHNSPNGRLTGQLIDWLPDWLSD